MYAKVIDKARALCAPTTTSNSTATGATAINSNSNGNSYDNGDGDAGVVPLGSNSRRFLLVKSPTIRAVLVSVK